MGQAFTVWLHLLAVSVWIGPQFFMFLAALPATAAGRREPPPPPWIALHLSGYENDDDLEVLPEVKPPVLLVVVGAPPQATSRERPRITTRTNIQRLCIVDCDICFLRHWDARPVTQWPAAAARAAYCTRHVFDCADLHSII